MKTLAALLITALVLAAGARALRAEEFPAAADTAGVAGEDSTQVEGAPPSPYQDEEPDAAAEGRLFAPRWTVTYKADESSYMLGSGMRISIDAPGGWRGSSSVRLTKRSFRGRDMQTLNHTIANTASKIVPDSYEAFFKVGENYSRRKAVGLARTGGALVVEDEYADAGLTVYRPLPFSTNSQFSVQGRGSRGTNDFKYDRLLEGGAGGYTRYRLFDIVTLGGGYGIARRKESSEVGSRIFGGMPSESDTIRASLRYVGVDNNLSLTYQRTMGVMRKVDPPRGNSLEVIENPDLALLEESRQKNELLAINSLLKPTRRLELDFAFNRNYFDQRNKIDTRLSRETENIKIRAKARYRYLPGGNADIEIERAENDIDYGPVSLSSYLEQQRVLRLALDQSIGKTLRMSLRGTTSLQQRFFKKKDANPRDVDYLLHTVTANLDTRLPRDISTGVKFTFRRYETINIDQGLSGDNRTDYTYWVVPRLSFKPAAWLTLSQEYEIKMEFADFTFKDNENFLNRTTVLNTDARMRFYRPLTFSIRHRYIFTDTGSYLRPATGGDRLYGRTNESYENRVDFSLDYAPVQDFKFFASSNYRFQETNRLGHRDGSLVVTGSNTYDSGEMSLGFSRRTVLPARGRADLDIRWVRRFGPNLTPERREFWRIDMDVGFNF